MTLEGRRALVTAGSSGIGAAVATALRSAGADVFITGMSAYTPTTADAVGAAGSVMVDFRRPGAAERAAGAAVDCLGGVDIVVANTGGPRPARFADLGAEDWDEAHRLVLDSAITLTRELLPGMINNGWGRLIYITSAGVVRPVPRLHLSNVMRAGVAALARSLAPEVGPHGVTTHVIAPAHIDTPRRVMITESAANEHGISVEEAERAELARVPVGRWGRPEEVGELVAYLSSDAATFQTGLTHLVDGGSFSV